MKKWYMYHPASILENVTHKILGDFDIQTGRLISTGASDSKKKKKKKKKEKRKEKKMS